MFTSLILVGDLNADFVRKSAHVQATCQFIENLNLYCAWQKFEIDFTHVHEINDMSYVSTIDHLFWSDNICDLVVDAGVIHSVDNPSDHSPVYCVIKNLKLSSNNVK